MNRLIIPLRDIIVYFLLSILLNECSGKKLRIGESTYGVVGGGNYSYFTHVVNSEYDFDLIVTLAVHDGDADLYISQTNEPTYDTEGHDYQATSCGEVEKVELPSSYLKNSRHIIIGVYGHPRYDTSSFTLKIDGLLTQADLVKLESTMATARDDYNSMYDFGGAMSTYEGQDDSAISFSWKLTFANLLEEVLAIVFEVLT